jgi:hypothetical protein
LLKPLVLELADLGGVKYEIRTGGC